MPEVPALAVERNVDSAKWNVLKRVLYPGASDEMVALALDYCKARGLDPMKKPVHIVKTWDPEENRMVEGIWEGINSHRTTAARTNGYAGISKPEFGPTATIDTASGQVNYPEWCSVTVKRIISGHICEFTSFVRWLESYARRKGGAPNAMWARRPFSQLAKCAEADALRKAFPEEIGGDTTAEEVGISMEPARELEYDSIMEPKKVSRLEDFENRLSSAVDCPPAIADDAGEISDAIPPTDDLPGTHRIDFLTTRYAQYEAAKDKIGLKEWMRDLSPNEVQYVRGLMKTPPLHKILDAG